MPKIMTKKGFRINHEVVGNPSAKHTIIFSHGNGNSISDWKTLSYTEVVFF